MSDPINGLDNVSADLNKPDGLDELAAVFGIDMSKRETIVSTMPAHPSELYDDVPDIDSEVFLSGPFDAQRAQLWVNVIEFHRDYLVQLKTEVAQQVGERIKTGGLATLATFGLLMRPELRDLAKLRTVYLSEIKKVIVSGLSERIASEELKAQINEYLESITDYEEEDMTVNGTDRVAEPVPDAAYYRKALHIE